MFGHAVGWDGSMSQVHGQSYVCYERFLLQLGIPISTKAWFSPWKMAKRVSCKFKIQ